MTQPREAWPAAAGQGTGRGTLPEGQAAPPALGEAAAPARAGEVASLTDAGAGPGGAGLAWRGALLLLGLLGAGLVLRRLGLDGAIAQAGDSGPLAFVGVGTLACALGLPRQVVAYAGGLAFGFWPGAALALLVEVLACAADFYWARLLGRRWAQRWLRDRAGSRAGAWLGRLDRFMAARAFTATLTLRLLPVGSNIVLNVLAGVTGVAAGPFLLASLIGYVPQTAVFALLGGGVRVSQAAQVGLGVVLFAASIGLGLLLLRRRPIAAA